MRSRFESRIWYFRREIGAKTQIVDTKKKIGATVDCRVKSALRSKISVTNQTLMT